MNQEDKNGLARLIIEGVVTIALAIFNRKKWKERRKKKTGEVSQDGKQEQNTTTKTA